MKALHFIADRFKEPSSWAGLSGVIAMFGLNLPNGVIQNVTLIGAGVCGLVAFFTADKV